MRTFEFKGVELKVIKLNSDTDLKGLLTKIGVDRVGVEIMAEKKCENLFLIKELPTPAANILKQDALSIGAEAALPKGAVNCEVKFVDCVLICSTKQLKQLIKKASKQPFGLKNLSFYLKEFLKSPSFEKKVMGIINANSDSFYEGSRFLGKEALSKIEEMINDGAKIIDVGAVSTRPGSEYPGVGEEFARIKPIIDELKKSGLMKHAVFSIDTFTPEVLEYALDSGFEIANDITGLESDEYAKIVAKYDASVVIMHKKGTPKTMQQAPFYEDVISEVDSFFEERINKALRFGINKIILDVGIGFGKRKEDNLALIKHMEHFTRFGYELLLGASRKSLIDMIIPTPIDERLPGSLILHTYSKSVSIIRVHDVKAHVQALAVMEALRRFDV